MAPYNKFHYKSQLNTYQSVKKWHEKSQKFLK